MSIRKLPSGSYEVRVADFPSRTFPVKKLADKHELNLRIRLSAGDLVDEDETSFGDEIDGYLAWKKTLSASGYRSLEWSAKIWAPYRDLRVSKLRRAALEDHILARAADAPRSALNELVFLKAVLTRAKDRGQRVDERILAIPPIRHTAREGVALNPTELAFLAGVFPEHLRRFVLLDGTIGARASELYTLQTNQLDLDASPEPLLRVWRDVRGNKSRKEKAIPLTPGERSLLREQLLARTNGTPLVFPRAKGTAYTVNGFLKDVWYPKRRLAAKKWREQNGLAADAPTPFLWLEDQAGKPTEVGVTVHHLRHTAISLMCRAGYRPEWVAERVGHNDGGALILRKYRHLYPSEMSSVAPNLDALLATGSSQLHPKS